MTVLVTAVITGLLLLAIAAVPLFDQFNAATRAWAGRQNPRLSAAPLLLSGFGLIGAQWILRPALGALFKRLMLSAAFILWGIVQLMPASALSIELGNVVITLYVIDLALMVGDELRGARVSARNHTAIHGHADAGDV